MRCEAWIGGIFVESELTEDVKKEILTFLKAKGMKVYERPEREPDFVKEMKDGNGLPWKKTSCWFSEGIAIDSHINRLSSSWSLTGFYQIFFNKKRPNEVGFRALEYKRSKRMTSYRSDSGLATHFKNTIAFNVILGEGEEPKDFGKIPPLK